MISSLSQLAATPSTPATDNLIKDVGLATFMADVIEASKQHIVIVDFWAPWCGPCKQLGPALESVVRSYKGAIHLAKVDIDQNQEIAQQMGIQSIPAVFAFYKGRPVDGFQGALPVAQIKTWIEHLIKATGASSASEADGLGTALKQAEDFLIAKDVLTAQSIYADILDMDPANAAAYAGLLRCLLALGDIEKAKAMFEKAPADMLKDKVFDAVRASLELAEQVVDAAPLANLQAQVEKDPANYQARYDLALAQYAAGQKEDAVDQLLDIVRRNRTWNDDAARKQLVKFFEAFGVMDPLTISARKRLSSILFS